MLERWDAIDIYGALREVAAGRPAVDPPRRPAVRQRPHPHRALLNKVLKDIVVKSRTMAGHRRRLRPRLGLPRAAHRAPGRQGARARQRGSTCAARWIRSRSGGAAATTRAASSTSSARSSSGWACSATGESLPDDGARLRGDHRARARPLRRAGARLQGPEARSTGACTARRRSPRPRSSTRSRRRPSVYVTFPAGRALARARAGARRRRASLVIWTTTPWTLPANLAVAVHPEEEYVALDVGRPSG